MNTIVVEEAGEELQAAATWYESEREGLGQDLLVEADRALSAIGRSPTTWPLVPGSKLVRRFLLTRFPYAAYFVVRDGLVIVLAFGHTSRKPGYWRNRLR